MFAMNNEQLVKSCMGFIHVFISISLYVYVFFLILYLHNLLL